jgi:predicted signal transduction protein with EAL and GGDEF domain
MSTSAMLNSTCSRRSSPANDEGMLSLAALDLVQRTDCVAIVRAISNLGCSLNIATTAEGVETMDQLDRLRAEGCNEVQGYLFSAAKPASESRNCWLVLGRGCGRQR